MATTIKALARGAFATSSGTLYTVPAGTTTVVTNISVCNTTSTAGTFSILLDGVELVATAAIAGNTTAVFDLKQALAATKVVAGLASATTIKYHITGAEIA